VLASGDPFVYGVGTVLAHKIDPAEMLAVPAPAAFSLAAARLGWPLPDTAQVSLHGRALRPCPSAFAARHAHSGADI